MDIRSISAKEFMEIQQANGRAIYYEPTFELRWLGDWIEGSRPVLQQKWVEHVSGEFEWRDVPLEMS